MQVRFLPWERHYFSNDVLKMTRRREIQSSEVGRATAREKQRRTVETVVFSAHVAKRQRQPVATR